MTEREQIIFGFGYACGSNGYDVPTALKIMKKADREGYFSCSAEQLLGLFVLLTQKGGKGSA